jgi:hypothetical protein
MENDMTIDELAEEWGEEKLREIAAIPRHDLAALTKYMEEFNAELEELIEMLESGKERIREMTDETL